jgi:predicted methyltransferase
MGSIPGANRFFWQVVDLERGPLSLVSTIEELLERKKIAASVYETEITAVGDPPP